MKDVAQIENINLDKIGNIIVSVDGQEIPMKELPTELLEEISNIETCAGNPPQIVNFAQKLIAERKAISEQISQTR